MSFKFMHSKIDTRSAVPSLSEVVKLAQTKKALASGNGQVKTASAAAAPKLAKKEKEAEEECMADDEANEGEENAAFPGAAPKFKKKESKKASTSKVAEKEEGESSGQLEPKKNPTNDPEKPEGAKATGGKGKGGESDEGESSGQLDVEPLHQEGESTGQKPSGLDTQKGGEGKKEASQKKEARFVRVAELTDKQKEFLRKTWSLYWPKSFIDALLSAK